MNVETYNGDYHEPVIWSKGLHDKTTRDTSEGSCNECEEQQDTSRGEQADSKVNRHLAVIPRSVISASFNANYNHTRMILLLD